MEKQLEYLSLLRSVQSFRQAIMLQNGLKKYSVSGGEAVFASYLVLGIYVQVARSSVANMPFGEQILVRGPKLLGV